MHYAMKFCELDFIIASLFSWVKGYVIVDVDDFICCTFATYFLAVLSMIFQANSVVACD